MQTFFNSTNSRVSTNCPLFSWMMKNEENYNQAVALGLVENKPFRADNYSAVGFELMSTIVRRKLVINREIEIAVNKRFEVIGSDRSWAFTSAREIGSRTSRRRATFCTMATSSSSCCALFSRRFRTPPSSSPRILPTPSIPS